MTEIQYKVGPTTSGKITWAASEHFGELANKIYHLGEMEAVEIVKMPELSDTAKILLSAVAGAIIQHLLDQGISAEEIFKNGTFEVLV